MATAAVFFFTQKPDTLIQLRRFRWDVGIGLFAVVGAAWLCNGGRVYILSHSLGYPLTFKQSMSVSLSTEFGIAATPGGVGGALIRLTLLKRAGVPIAHGTSMLTTDIATDILFFTILFPFAAAALMNNPKIASFFRENILEDWMPVVLFAAAIIFLLVLVKKLRLVYRLFYWLSHRPQLQRYRLLVRGRWLRWKWITWRRQFQEGIGHLLALRKGAVFLAFLLCSAQWTCRYSILPIALYSLSIPCDPLPLFLLQGVLFMFALLVVLPGGGGGVELSMAFILGRIYPVSIVGVVVLLWRLFTYHLYMLGGGIMFFWTFAHLNALFPASSPPAETAEFSLNDE
ncbi:MAG: lysylphosphatidylglycerol synthase transmembrane domain-containing protein [Candidatus Omnitrophota bacterium]